MNGHSSFFALNSQVGEMELELLHLLSILTFNFTNTKIQKAKPTKLNQVNLFAGSRAETRWFHAQSHHTGINSPLFCKNLQSSGKDAGILTEQRGFDPRSSVTYICFIRYLQGVTQLQSRSRLYIIFLWMKQINSNRSTVSLIKFKANKCCQHHPYEAINFHCAFLANGEIFWTSNIIVTLFFWTYFNLTTWRETFTQNNSSTALAWVYSRKLS